MPSRFQSVPIALLLSCYVPSGVLLGEFVPYQVAVLNEREGEIIKVDMDAGTQTVTPIVDIDPASGRFSPSAIAAGLDGSLLAVDSSSLELIVGQLNWRTDDWQVTRLPTAIGQRTGDLDIADDGSLILVPDDTGVVEVNPKTGAARSLISSTDAGPFRAEVAPPATVIADRW